MSDVLKFEVADQVARITMNRPEALNAVNPALRDALTRAFETVRDDPSIRVAVLTGAGDRAFSAGSDLKWRAANEDAVAEQRLSRGPFAILDPGFGCWKPIIAAVNGYAVGGGLEIALACDLIVAAEHAQFGCPEPRRGIMAGWGGVHRLPRQLPLKQAMSLILTGRLISADEAYRIGLVNEVAPLEQLGAATDRWVAEILKCSPLAVQASKQAALTGLNMPLDAALSATYEMHERLAASPDFTEGPRAFAEKRNPVWGGDPPVR